MFNGNNSNTLLKSTLPQLIYVDQSKYPKTYAQCVLRSFVYLLLIKSVLAAVDANMVQDSSNQTETADNNEHRRLSLTVPCTITTP